MSLYLRFILSQLSILDTVLYNLPFLRTVTSTSSFEITPTYNTAITWPHSCSIHSVSGFIMNKINTSNPSIDETKSWIVSQEDDTIAVSLYKSIMESIIYPMLGMSLVNFLIIVILISLGLTFNNTGLIATAFVFIIPILQALYKILYFDYDINKLIKQEEYFENFEYPLVYNPNRNIDLHFTC